MTRPIGGEPEQLGCEGEGASERPPETGRLQPIGGEPEQLGCEGEGASERPPETGRLQPIGGEPEQLGCEGEGASERPPETRRPCLAACAATLFVLLTQRAVYADPGSGWLGLSFAAALGALAGPAARIPPPALWVGSCVLLALAALPVPLPAWLAAATPLAAVAGAGAWARVTLSGRPRPVAAAILGAFVACGGAGALRWTLSALGIGVYSDVPFALAGLVTVLALGLVALGKPADDASPADAEPRHATPLATLACFRCAAVTVLAWGIATAIDGPRPWVWGAWIALAALVGALAAARWSSRRRLLAEVGGWLAAAVVVGAGSLSLPALVGLVGCSAATAAAAAHHGLSRSWKPLLAVIAGGLVGASAAPTLYASWSTRERVLLALGSPNEEALERGVASGLVRERYTVGGHGGVQVLDVGGDKPLRLLTRHGRVLEALPQRRDAVPDLLRAQAFATALAAWLAPAAPRVLVAGVGSGYGEGLLAGSPGVELLAVEGSPGIAATWTEPGDLWGLFNRRLGADPQRLARIVRGPLHPHLLHGQFDSVLLQANPNPATLGAALRHPLVVGPLTLSSGVAELQGWAQASELLVFQPPESEVRVVVAGQARVSWTRLLAGWERGGPLRTELERLGVSSPAQLVACLQGGTEAARLALRSPDPAGTLQRAGAELGPSLVADADAASLVAITEFMAAAGSPATLRWAQAAVSAERTAPALATLGALLLNSGDPELGRAHLREALDLDPAHDPARLQLAFDLQRDDPPAAEALLRAGLRADSAQPALHYALAKLTEARGDSRAALTHFEAAGESGDAATRARELRGALQREHSVGTQVKAAYALLQAAERGEADSAQGLELALKLVEADLEREDRLLLGRALAGFADLEQVALLRANLHRHRARVLTPLASEPRLAVRAAEAWLAGDRPNKALELLEPLCAGPDGQRPRALRLLGDAHALRGDAALARDAYRRALDLGPELTSNGLTYERLARLEAREGNLRLGLELLRGGDRALGGVARLRRTRAELLEAVGRDVEARAAWEAYLEVAPPGPERRAIEARLGK